MQGESGTDPRDPCGTRLPRDHRHNPIARLLTTRDPVEVERVADELAHQARLGPWTRRERRVAIEALVLCLTGDSIRQDADAEDAICSALAQLGVMTRHGNGVFTFVPDVLLATSDLATVHRYRTWLPARYTAIGAREELGWRCLEAEEELP